MPAFQRQQLQKSHFISKSTKRSNSAFDETQVSESQRTGLSGLDLDIDGSLGQSALFTSQFSSQQATTQQKQPTGKNEKGQTTTTEDFSYYSMKMSYNVFLPRHRRYASNHPYLMTEPNLYIDFCPFEEAKNAQK